MSARHVQMGALQKREIDAALEAPEVQPRKTSAARCQRTFESAADPQLVAGRAAEESYVRCDALLDLHALLQNAIFVADEAAAESGQMKKSWRLKREESRIGVFKPLRMRRRRNCESAQRDRDRDCHADTGDS